MKKQCMTSACSIHSGLLIIEIIILYLPKCCTVCVYTKNKLKCFDLWYIVKILCACEENYFNNCHCYIKIYSTVHRDFMSSISIARAPQTSPLSAWDRMCIESYVSNCRRAHA